MNEGEENEVDRAWTNVTCHKRPDQLVGLSQTAVSSKRPRQSPETSVQVFESPNRFTPLSGSEAELDKRPPPINIKDVNVGEYKTLVANLKNQCVGGENFECQATRYNGVA
jgi:hypothetical protein